MRKAWQGLVIAVVVAALVVGTVFALHTINHPVRAPQAAPTPAPARHPPGPPPGAETVTVLMNEEIAAVLDRNIISQIYAPNARVEDAACGSPGRSRAWTGRDQIMARYQGLGRFASLQHVHVKVQWTPDNSQADQATVTAQTVGEMGSRGGSLHAVYGKEVWHFARLPSGRWVITSFTYHACLPPS
jgi:hypothetical protein